MVTNVIKKKKKEVKAVIVKRLFVLPCSSLVKRKLSLCNNFKKKTEVKLVAWSPGRGGGGGGEA